MAGVAGGRLAAAVSKAGGLGFVAGGYGNAQDLDTQLDLSAGQDVGVGFITWALDQNPRLLDKALDHGVKALFLSFGDIRPHVAKAHRFGIPVFAQVQSVKAASEAADQGADFIIAQGGEAGGHGATRGTMALLPAIVDTIAPKPVIGAGGIADGRTLAAAVLLGAEAVVLGTSLYVANEALSHEKAKDIAVKAQGDETVRSSFFDLIRGRNWPSPYTLRTLRNSYYDQWAAGSIANPTSIRNRLDYRTAEEAGDFSKAAVIVGEAVDLVKKRESAQKIISRIVADAENRLSAAPTHIELEGGSID